MVLSGVGEKLRLPHDLGDGEDSRDDISDTGEVSPSLDAVDVHLYAVQLAPELNCPVCFTS